MNTRWARHEHGSRVQCCCVVPVRGRHRSSGPSVTPRGGSGLSRRRSGDRAGRTAVYSGAMAPKGGWGPERRGAHSTGADGGGDRGEAEKAIDIGRHQRGRRRPPGRSRCSRRPLGTPSRLHAARAAVPLLRGAMAPPPRWASSAPISSVGSRLTPYTQWHQEVTNIHICGDAATTPRFGRHGVPVSDPTGP